MSPLEQARENLQQATARHDALVARYNREWRARRWSTNRDLAGRAENAYDAMVRARLELAALLDERTVTA